MVSRHSRRNHKAGLVKCYREIVQVPSVLSYELVGKGGLEPQVSTMSIWRSNRLSYLPFCRGV